MLQKLRDSVNVEKYAEYIRIIEEYSRNLTSVFQQFFKTNINRVVIAFHRYGYLPASVMYWFITTMDSDKYVLINEVDVVTHYILPYVENCYSILFTTNPYSASTIRFLQTSSLLGNDYLLVSMKPRDGRVLDMLSRYRVLYVDKTDELEVSLITTIMTYYLMSSIYSGKLGARGSRIREHAVEGLYPIVEELINKYIDRIERIFQSKNWVLTSTRMLEPVSSFIIEVLNRIGINSFFKPFEQITSSENVLILSTSIDEHIVREHRFRYSLMKNTVEEITLNTDPLEAQIYIAILFYYILYSFRQDRGV